MPELPKNYEPKDVEDKWYAQWEDNKCFAADEHAEGEPFSIVIPPPNVTGILHIGHALNNTIQDVLIRSKRMQGFNTVWVPGTDHAGIATQAKVVDQLREEGTTRQELGREKFIERVWEWKEKYGSTITMQLRKMGASCDWDRERFTMDEGLSDAVTEVFCKLFEKELIYQGDYIINWSTGLQTALADDEVEYKDTKGKLYYIKYPVEGGKPKETITVATTRPETMLGDVAVAVNPRDDRYEGLEDKKIILPFMERELVVIKDDYVDPEFGTGIVKITPAHDPNDFDMGKRHDLTPINVMNPDGTMNDECGKFSGMDRFACRKALIKELDAMGLVDHIDEHDHSVGYCYRSNTVIEPRLSRQWFVKMKPLARMAIDALEEEELTFIPERWTKVYLHWMENIRDWCISRQLWWGHRIPIYYCDSTGEMWASKETPTQSPSGATDIRQDEDVLDTWFSSALWPFSVHNWPEETKSLEKYYPSSVLVTAPDIIFFWVARMVMMGKEFRGEVPFAKVYLHGVVRDEQGNKQSKSLGNAVDPLEVIDQYSADALRFCLIILNATGQDIYISTDKFEMGRNFCTKIWNAARFISMQSEEIPSDFADPNFNKDLLSPDDLHLLYNLNSCISNCTENLEKFRFNDYAKELYDFIWHKFCDWYVETSKSAFFGDDQARKENVLKVIHHVFSNALKLLHPLMPFITEELWEQMGYKNDDFIMLADWPKVRDSETMLALGVSASIVDYVDAKHDAIRVGRLLKSDYNLAANKDVKFTIKPSKAKLAEMLEADMVSFKNLLRAGEIIINADYDSAAAVPSAISKLGNVYMPVAGLVDTEAEIEKLTKQLDKVTGDLDKINKKLNNESFISKAPEDVIDIQKGFKKDLVEKTEKLNKLISTLSGS